jgi:hypothetical protein
LPIVREIWANPCHEKKNRNFPRGAQSPPGQRARDTTAKAGGTQVDPVNNTPNIFSRETPHTRARKRACDTPRHPPDRCHRSPSHGGRSPRLSSPSQAAATGQVSEASSPSQRPPSPPPALQPTARGNQPPSLPQARNQPHPSPRVTPPPVYPCALPVYEDTTINWISCTVMVGLLASALLLQRLVRTTAYNHPSTVRRASRAITLPPPSGVLPCRRYSALGLSPSLACSQPLLSSSCISLHSYTSLLSCISLVCATPAPELAETRACILANAFTAEESVPGSSSALLLSISC